MGGRAVRQRFWAEVVLGGTGVVLAVLTMLVPDWIERLGGAGGDGGSGGTERMVAAAFLVAAAAAALSARIEWRRTMKPALAQEGSAAEGG